MCSRVFPTLVFTAGMFPALSGLGGFRSLISLGVLIVSVRIVVRHGNSSEVMSGSATTELQSLCHDPSELNQYVGAQRPANFDNICSACGIYFRRVAQLSTRRSSEWTTRCVGDKLLLAQYRQLLRITEAFIERLQLRELALLRRARDHVIANELQLVAQIGQQRLQRRGVAGLVREQ
jgi:hypothetical protein